MGSISSPTLPETNIAPEKGWLKDEFPFGMAYFQGRVLLISGRDMFFSRNVIVLRFGDGMENILQNAGVNDKRLCRILGLLPAT